MVEEEERIVEDGSAAGWMLKWTLQSGAADGDETGRTDGCRSSRKQIWFDSVR